MAGSAVKLVVLMIVVASVCLDVCQACGECGTPSIPLPKPPKAPKAPKPPKMPYKPPMTPIIPPIIRTPPRPPTCPVSLVQLNVCSPLLGGILGGILPPSDDSCCALLNLLGLDVEVCLCLAIDANILGLININAKVDAVVSILTTCGYKVPPIFACPI